MVGDDPVEAGVTVRQLLAVRHGVAEYLLLSVHIFQKLGRILHHTGGDVGQEDVFSTKAVKFRLLPQLPVAAAHLQDRVRRFQLHLGQQPREPGHRVV